MTEYDKQLYKWLEMCYNKLDNLVDGKYAVIRPVGNIHVFSWHDINALLQNIEKRIKDQVGILNEQNEKQSIMLELININICLSNKIR